jgi:rhodanese-related sulfurtransferase
MMTMDRLVEFAGNHPELFLALGVVLALLGWSAVRGRLQGWKAVGPLEATQLINHQDAVVLDIREANEVGDGYILNSVHVPLSQLKDRVQRLEKYKRRPVVVACRSGSRSSVACTTLSKHDFSDLYHLRGGILAWQGANLPLTKKKP